MLTAPTFRKRPKTEWLKPLKALPVLLALAMLVSCKIGGGGSLPPLETGVTPGTTAGAASQSVNPEGLLKVHFLDVGQGDSIFIELPNRQSLLIDAGGISGDGITATIKALGYTSLDYVVATHPHNDHVGGMDEVIDAFEVKSFYMPDASSTTDSFKNMMTAIEKEGCGIITAKAGLSIFDSENLKISVLAPVYEQYNDLNNYSAVIKLAYGKSDFLFMGDAGTLSESQITSDIDADVLKVGHHGSTDSTSGDFLQKVSPEYAVISCGKGNDFGHPRAATLSKLEKANVKVYRTDLAGTILFTSDGETISVDKQPDIGKPGLN